MMVALFLIMALLVALTLLGLRLTQWFELRYSLQADTVAGIYLLSILLSWWLVGAFIATTVFLHDDRYLAVAAMVFVLAATAMFLWGYYQLKKNQLST